jgi:hypothetical protein
MRRTGMLKHCLSIFNSDSQRAHKVECFLVKKEIMREKVKLLWHGNACKDWQILKRQTNPATI